MTAAEAELRYRALLRDLAAAHPGFRLVHKRDVWHQRAIHRALLVLTLGQMRTYLSDFQTTIGATIYVTEDWDERPAIDRWATLRHEAVHILQFRRFGLVGMAILYLLLPLPMGLAYFRMRLEREAYEESLRALHEAYGEAALRDPARREHMIALFTSSAYGWMWPFPESVRRWYERFVEGLVRGSPKSRL